MFFLCVDLDMDTDERINEATKWKNIYTKCSELTGKKKKKQEAQRGKKHMGKISVIRRAYNDNERSEKKSTEQRRKCTKRC